MGLRTIRSKPSASTTSSDKSTSGSSRMEFEDAVATFGRCILEQFKDPTRMVVRADHVLAVATKR